MKGIFIRSIWIILVILMLGCEKTGYMIIISTNHFKYRDLQQIGRILEDKGFKIGVWERKRDKPEYPDEVYTLFEKKVSDKPYHLVDVYLNYVKDISNDIAHDLRIDVSNVYKGITITELKDEIDKIGDLIYLELVDKIGKENVVIERKEIHHRMIPFQ